MRGLMAAIVWTLALLAAPSGVRAGEPSPVWKDGWIINAPGVSNWVSDGTPTSYSLQRAAATPFVPGSAKDPYGFADYSIGRTLGFGREYGLGDIQATLGVRTPEPLATNGFTPAYDPRLIGAARESASRATRPCSRHGSSSGTSVRRFCSPTARLMPMAVSPIRYCRSIQAAAPFSMSMACSACPIGSTPRRN